MEGGLRCFGSIRSHDGYRAAAGCILQSAVGVGTTGYKHASHGSSSFGVCECACVPILYIHEREGRIFFHHFPPSCPANSSPKDRAAPQSKTVRSREKGR